MANYDLEYEGSEVQDILDTGKALEDDGYIFLGTATPSTLPGTPTERVAYIGGPGTYNNFGTTVVVPSGSIVVITYSGSAWSKVVLNATLPVATTLGSDNTTIPTSKAVKDVTDAIMANIGNGYVYAGIATPTGTPVTGKVFYIATAAGTYTNFGSQVMTQGLNILKYNGSVWSSEQIIGFDDYPTGDSQKLPKSGGVDAEIKSLTGYYVCGTAAATAAKTISASYYILLQGGSIKVKFTYKNTADDATLKIGNADAKPLFYADRRAGSSNSWEAGEVVEIFYDGTNYMANNVMGGGIGDGVFDISVYNADNGVPHPYTDLAAALGTNGEHIPQSLRKGGMSVKFIKGSVPSSDNKYVQYRLTADEFSINPSDWYNECVYVSQGTLYVNDTPICSVAGYDYIATAFPSTNPGTPNANVVYSAYTAGIYPNMGNIKVYDGELKLIVYTKSSNKWTSRSIHSNSCHYKESGTFIANTSVISYVYVTGKKLRVVVNSGDRTKLTLIVNHPDGTYTQNDLSSSDNTYTFTKDIYSATVQTKTGGAGTYDIELFAGLSLELSEIDETLYRGIAQPATVPDTSKRGIWLAAREGQYINYGNLTVRVGEVCVFKYNKGTNSWSRTAITCEPLYYKESGTYASSSWIFQYRFFRGRKIRIISEQYAKIQVTVNFFDGTYQIINPSSSDQLITTEKDMTMVSIFVKAGQGGDITVEVLGGKTALDIYDLQKEVDSIVAEVDKEGEPNTTVHFTVPVNVDIDNFTDKTTSLQDSSTIQQDHAVIMLPPNYTKAGKPVPLFIHCHGAGGYDYTSQTPAVSAENSTIENAAMCKYLCANGFAVLDTNGMPAEWCTDNNLLMSDNLGTPMAIQCYIHAYKYAIEHFNIKEDGVVLYGASMGGLVSTNLLLTGAIPVRLHTMMCPCLDTFNQAWEHPWYSPTNHNVLGLNYNFPKQYGAYVYDESKMRGFNPTTHGMKSFASDGTLVPSAGAYDYTTEELNGEVVTEYREHPVILKIWHCTNDTTVDYGGTKRFVKAINNAGGMAYLRTFTTGAHSPMTVGTPISSPSGSTNYRGTTVSVYPAVEELYLFIKRFM